MAKKSALIFPAKKDAAHHFGLNKVIGNRLSRPLCK